MNTVVCIYWWRIEWYVYSDVYSGEEYSGVYSVCETMMCEDTIYYDDMLIHIPFTIYSWWWGILVDMMMMMMHTLLCTMMNTPWWWCMLWWCTHIPYDEHSMMLMHDFPKRWHMHNLMTCSDLDDNYDAYLLILLMMMVIKKWADLDEQIPWWLGMQTMSRLLTEGVDEHIDKLSEQMNEMIWMSWGWWA